MSIDNPRMLTLREIVVHVLSASEKYAEMTKYLMIGAAITYAMTAVGVFVDGQTNTWFDILFVMSQSALFGVACVYIWYSFHLREALKECLLTMNGEQANGNQEKDRP